VKAHLKLDIVTDWGSVRSKNAEDQLFLNLIIALPQISNCNICIEILCSRSWDVDAGIVYNKVG